MNWLVLNRENSIDNPRRVRSGVVDATDGLDLNINDSGWLQDVKLKIIGVTR